MKKITLTFLAFLFLTNCANTTKEKPLTLPYIMENTYVLDFISQINKIHYNLYVSIPKGYDKYKENYPVIYTLDADYAFAIAKNITDHLSDRNLLPHMIIVSIAYDGASMKKKDYYKNRSRDYTPSSAKGGYDPSLKTGEGETFRKVIEKEIIPFINLKFKKANPNDKTLVGHSLGGLFGTYVLFNFPKMFEKYILVSPSLWWDHGSGLAYERNYASKHSNLKAKVFYGIGSYENSGNNAMVSQLNLLVKRVRKENYKDLTLYYHVFDGEIHNSVFPSAFTRGVQKLFN